MPLLTKFVCVVEDGEGNVIGAQTSGGEIRLAPEQIVPRADLKTVAATLATQYGVDPASFTLPAAVPNTPPPPAE